MMGHNWIQLVQPHRGGVVFVQTQHALFHEGDDLADEPVDEAHGGGVGRAPGP
jgi:hypothetical protein